jgi:ABC-type branched-subunit amino acid transport system substrate-binding protein
LVRAFLQRLRSDNPALIYLGLGGATVLLLLTAVLGAIVTRPDTTRVATGEGAEAQEKESKKDGKDKDSKEASEEEKAAAAAGSQAAGAAPGGQSIEAFDLPSVEGATRVGVTAQGIRWGLHAPQTFDGQPLNLAEDPLKGVDIYLEAINQSGVHGRKIEKFFADDRYTVEGAKSASNTMFNDSKVFFASGTLGVDQVATVAAAARATPPTPTPYLAAGGSEADFRTIGMYQIAGSYDTHLIKLAEFLAKEVKKAPCVGSCGPDESIYSGLKRVAAVELDSKYIRGSVASLEAAVKASGLEWAGRVLVPKYTDSSNTHIYTGQCLELSQMNAQIVIPATDPLTTSNMTVTGECARFKWAMSNFAHDSDVALKLMGGTWTGVRGLAGGCYYQLWNDPNQAPKCGKLKEAHDAWVAVAGESDWNENGQGGLAGYQITHIWLGALTNAGPDLTREKFVAALNAYNNYDDLVTEPITYLNSPNIAHGIERFAVYEATPQQRWKQISDGLVGSF